MQFEQFISDSEFDWDSLLKQKNLEVLPEACLPHVYRKANLILQAGMKIEMPYIEDNKSKYWIATVVMSLGPVVRLQFLGDSNPTHDKWQMINSFKPHPLGWCERCNLSLTPPSYLSHVDKKALLAEVKQGHVNTVQEYAMFEYEQFVPGMKLEIEDEFCPYRVWVGNILENYGGRLQLRYDTPNPEEPSFWLFYTSRRIHPYGWTKSQALAEVKQGHVNTVQEYAMFEYEQFVPGMKLEIEDEFCPYRVWVGNILENYGGRLQLRYDTPNPEEPSFWLFYTSRRIHPYGWTKSQGAPWSIAKPSHLDNDTHSSEAWAALFEMNTFNFEMECKISKIRNYKYEPPQLKHELTVGTKLEAVDPKLHSAIASATVVQIFDPYYFLVQIDNSDSKFLATLDHPYIFPHEWAKSHGLEVHKEESPIDEDSNKLARFEKILKRNPNIPVTPGMKLEVVNPHNRCQMCVGTILSVIQDLLHVKLDIPGDQTKFWVDLMDCEVFPLGWSKSTGHPIAPPTDTPCLVEAKVEPASPSASVPRPPCIGCEKTTIYLNHKCFTGPFLSKSKLAALPKSCLPPCIGCEKTTIYLNHKCFTGPFLSKSKLAALPKVIGPGPVRLVLLDVVKRIANLAYVQMRILRELEAPSTKPPEGRTREELKVKYKKRVYKGTIEVATRLDAVEDYCMEICKKLQVCQNLISLKPCPECPLNCLERNKVKSSKDKKTNTKQSIDYKSFIYKPLTNPVSLVNRTPFQEDIPPPKETSPEENIVWNKEKCLRTELFLDERSFQNMKYVQASQIDLIIVQSEDRKTGLKFTAMKHDSREV
ncbi:scm-like with four MBT domains protein 1 [Diaphorina citri]|uniref:Scm-like with four MBT domains protein 1 n=1 Tax=Diaphorina citri TaxID=121845 RepID=A0A3Q0IK43_DIACI|nr:scm-like with four MBT domains protein 1 [Diaphorina citri]